MRLKPSPKIGSLAQGQVHVSCSPLRLKLRATPPAQEVADITQSPSWHGPSGAMGLKSCIPVPLLREGLKSRQNWVRGTAPTESHGQGCGLVREKE